MELWHNASGGTAGSIPRHSSAWPRRGGGWYDNETSPGKRILMPTIACPPRAQRGGFRRLSPRAQRGGFRRLSPH